MTENKKNERKISSLFSIITLTRFFYKHHLYKHRDSEIWPNSNSSNFPNSRLRVTFPYKEEACSSILWTIPIKEWNLLETGPGKHADTCLDLKIGTATFLIEKSRGRYFFYYQNNEAENIFMPKNHEAENYFNPKISQCPTKFSDACGRRISGP